MLFHTEDIIEADPRRQRDSKGQIPLVVDVRRYPKKSLSNENLLAFSFRRFLRPSKIEVRIYNRDKGWLR